MDRSRGRFPISAIARTLGVSRSNLIDRTNKPSKPRGPYRKPEDVTLLAELRPVIDQRPTYGYRRLTALLNRQRRGDGKPMVNAKRVLRVMQQNGLTLQKHTALRTTRTHDGAVVALRSNIRWCSDHLEIHARNGEVVRIVVVIDACDCEIIAWSAVANAGISSEMVYDLMIAAVERRFQTLKAPHRLEWLSDNSSAYIARQSSGSRGPRHRPAHHPGSKPAEQGHVRGLRQDPKKGLCLGRHPTRYRHHPGLAAPMDRRLL